MQQEALCGQRGSNYAHEGLRQRFLLPVRDRCASEPFHLLASFTRYLFNKQPAMH